MLVYWDRKTPKRQYKTIKEQGWLRMEKTDMDGKRRTCKNLGQSFKTRKPWRSSFNVLRQLSFTMILSSIHSSFGRFHSLLQLTTAILPEEGGGAYKKDGGARGRFFFAICWLYCSSRVDHSDAYILQYVVVNQHSKTVCGVGGALGGLQLLMGHFRVTLCLCLKTSPRAKPFIWNEWFAF